MEKHCVFILLFICPWNATLESYHLVLFIYISYPNFMLGFLFRMTCRVWNILGYFIQTALVLQARDQVS